MEGASAAEERPSGGGGGEDGFGQVTRGLRTLEEALALVQADGSGAEVQRVLQAETARARAELEMRAERAEQELLEGRGRPLWQMPPAPGDRFGLGVWRTLRELALGPQTKCTVAAGGDKRRRRIVHELAERFGFSHIGTDKITVTKRNGYELVVPGEKDASELDSEETAYLERLKRFCSDNRQKTLNFPAQLSSEQRAKVHRVAEMFGGYLDHDTFGSHEDRDRYIRVTKVEPEVRKRNRRSLDALEEALNKAAESMPAAEPPPSVSPKRKTPAPSESGMRAVQWNIRWMDMALEDDRICWLIAAVILELGPDVLAVQEGPSSSQRMQAYVDRYLHGRYLVFGALEELRQQLFFLVRKDGPLSNVSVYEPSIAALSEPWQFDLDGDLSLPMYKFTRRPLVIRGTWQKRDVFFVTMHMKSKKTNQPGELTEEFIRKAVRNRRRLGAECFRLREIVTSTILEPFPDALLLTMGDLNTGPGTDFFQRYFLLFDSIDVLLGSPFEQTKRLFALLLTHSNDLPRDQMWTAEFNDFLDKKRKKVLVDHIFSSRSVLRECRVQTGIAHDIVNVHGEASDHVPVYCDLEPRGHHDKKAK